MLEKDPYCCLWVIILPILFLLKVKHLQAKDPPTDLLHSCPTAPAGLLVSFPVRRKNVEWRLVGRNWDDKKNGHEHKDARDLSGPHMTLRISQARKVGKSEQHVPVASPSSTAPRVLTRWTDVRTRPGSRGRGQHGRNPPFGREGWPLPTPIFKCLRSSIPKQVPLPTRSSHRYRRKYG